MKNLLTFLLIGFFVAGCSLAPQLDGSANLTATGETPSNTQGFSGAATNRSAAGSLPLIVTVRPPAVPIEPVQGSPLPPGSIPLPTQLSGWQTFTSSRLGVAVDYPSDWSAVEQETGASFTSPQGKTVLLQVVSASGSSAGNPAGNQECTLLVNVHGLSVEACGDSALDLYYAGFHILKADGSTEQLMLSTASRETLDVYKAMLNSLRPA